MIATFLTIPLVVVLFFVFLFTLLARKRRRERREIEESLTRMRATRVPLTKYKVIGRVWKESDAGVELLARGGTSLWARDPVAIKNEWERDMKLAFPQGPDYKVHYFCIVREDINA